MTSDPAGSLEFRATDAGLVRRYRFGVRSANFLICRECRLFVGVQMESDEDRYGVLNVLALRPLLSGLPVAGPMDYGAETGVVRRLRHESNWTPVETTSL